MRATTILQEIRALGRDLARRRGLDEREPFPLKRLVLPLTIDFEDGSSGKSTREHAEQLLRDLSGHLDEAMQALDALRPGHVYCFQCTSSDCPHSSPGSDDETFGGYTGTGKPIWQSFLNVCLERGEPRVDKLYSDSPEVITLYQMAEELKRDQLRAFGRDSLAFEVLGQVVAGLIPRELDGRRSSEGRVALTIQVVRTRRDDIGRRVRLNVLGLTHDDIVGAASNRPRGTADRLGQTLRATGQRVDSLGRKAAQAARRRRHLDLEAEVEPILARLRSDLDRIFRPHRSRTQHAEQRHRGGDRPTSSALRDAREAGEERFYFDSERKTIVIVGKRGRAHVFTPDGRHVTSIQLRTGEVERKTGRNRWRPLSRGRLAEFRSKLHGDS